MRAPSLALFLCVWGSFLPFAAGQASDPPADFPDPLERSPACIIARVDDKVVLLHEVIGPIREKLLEARKQMPAADYRKLCWEVIKKRSETHVQRLVLLKELETRFGAQPGAIDRVRKAAAKDFEKFLLQRAREMGLKSRDEVVAQLEKEGSKLDEVRNEFIDNVLAQSFIGQSVRPKVQEPTREDLYRYYQANADKFSREAGAVWSQVQVKHGDDIDAARRKADEARRRLQAGAAFADVAKKFSDGPTAPLGGQWSRTSPGSYADAAVDAAIFKMPVGQVSEIIEGKSAFHIVRVDERNDGGPDPFVDVQDKIRKLMRNEQMQALQKEVLDGMMSNHYIETLFDAGPTQDIKRVGGTATDDSGDKEKPSQQP